MEQLEILELALSAACDRWADARYMAGLDSSIDGLNVFYNSKPGDLKYYAEEMNIWSKKIDSLRNMIEEVKHANRTRKNIQGFPDKLRVCA